MSIKRFFTPSVFKIGILITIACAFVSFKYYNTPDHLKQNNIITDILYTLHLKTIDKRMIWRGEVPVTDNILLVTVDEASLEKFGRWPWPRNIMAKTIDTLNEHNVRTISFDIIFSEAEHDTIKQALEDVKKNTHSSELSQLIDKKIIESDNDQILANSIQKAKDKVILGGYYDPPYFTYQPYQEKCADRIDIASPEYTFIENQEFQMISLDETEVTLPNEIESLLDRSLQKIRKDTSSNNAEAFNINIRSLIEKKIF